MKKNNFICTKCPMGCNLTISVNGKNIIVKGNTCKAGEKYGVSEYTNPLRTITTSIQCKTNEGIKVLSVKTSNDIPKGKIFECLDEIKKIELYTNNVKVGDILVENILDLGVDIVATRNIN